MRQFLLLLLFPQILSAADVSYAPPGGYGTFDAFQSTSTSDLRPVVNSINTPSPDLATFFTSSGTLTGIGPSVTDLCTLYGSATKTVRVLQAAFGGVQTTAGVVQIQLVKRSAINTGAVASTFTAVSADSSNATATATSVYYSTAATVGTAVGPVTTARVLLPAPATATDPGGQFNPTYGLLAQAITLRGTAQGLGINFGGVSPAAGASYHCSWLWTEE